MARQDRAVVALVFVLLFLISWDRVLAAGADNRAGAQSDSRSRVTAPAAPLTTTGCTVMQPIATTSCATINSNFPASILAGQTITFSMTLSGTIPCWEQGLAHYGDPYTKYLTFTCSYMVPGSLVVQGVTPSSDELTGSTWGPPYTQTGIAYAPTGDPGVTDLLPYPPDGGSLTITVSLQIRPDAPNDCIHTIGGVSTGPFASLEMFDAYPHTGWNGVTQEGYLMPFQVTAQDQIALTDSATPAIAHPGDQVTFHITATPASPVTDGTLEEALPFPVPLGAEIVSSSVTQNGKIVESTYKGKKYPAGIEWPMSGAGPFDFSFELQIRPQKTLVAAFDLGAVWDACKAKGTVSGSSASATVSAQSLLIYDKTIHVTQTGDQDAVSPQQLPASDSTDPPTDVTLRAAIDFVNAHPGENDTIDFQISQGGSNTFDGGVPEIQPASALPAIQQPITIQGTTGSAPGVELDGEDASSANGITFTGQGSTLTGLVINRFTGDGVALAGGGCVVTGCYIGTDVTGSNPLGTAYKDGNTYGIYSNSGGNRVGGSSKGEGNVISGNNKAGIFFDSNAGANDVLGNIIGLDKSGTKAISNETGIILGGGENTIGGKAAGTGNVISGNFGNKDVAGGSGIHVLSGSSNNNILGNRIGTDATGESSVPNGLTGIGAQPVNPQNGGVWVEGSQNTIAANVIAGNLGGDVTLGGTGNVVQQNYLGVDAAGTHVLRYNSSTIFKGTLFNATEVGIDVEGVRNTIGGPNLGNLIYGVTLNGDHNELQGNTIGLAANGKSLLDSVVVSTNDTDVDAGIIDTGLENTIGGADAGDGNSLTGFGYGIQLQGQNTVVQGNFIGANDSFGTLGGKGDGILNSGITVVGGTPTIEGAEVNGGEGMVIGGSGAGEGNVIGFCGLSPNSGTPAGGIFVDQTAGSAGTLYLSPQSNTIEGNIIVHNDCPGVVVRDSDGVSILSNQIYSNGGIAISLVGYVQLQSGQNAPPAAPNRDLNPPNTVTATLTSPTITVSGTYVGGPPNTTLTFQIYSSVFNGDAQKLLTPAGGTATMTTDAAGDVDSFSFAVLASSVIATTSKGHKTTLIAITATDTGGNTSQVSTAATVTLGR